MVSRATFGSEPTLHISENIVGFKVTDKSTVDHLFHGFTDATCQRNRTIFGRICWILILMIFAFLQSEGKSPEILNLFQMFKRNNREEMGRCLRK